MTIPFPFCNRGESIDADLEKLANRIVNQDTRRDAMCMPEFAYSLWPSADGVATTVDIVARDIECFVVRENVLHTELQSPIRDVVEWSKVGEAVVEPEPLYGYFAGMVKTVGMLLPTHGSGFGRAKRLLIPTGDIDFSPQDRPGSRQVGIALVAANVHAADANIQTFADVVCVVKARLSRFEDKVALAQLSLCMAWTYEKQHNRRYMWGSIVCASRVYASLMEHGRTVVSQVMDMATPEGRKALVGLLVFWSMCPLEHLGFDPTMRVSSWYRQHIDSGDVSLADDITYQMDFSDGKEGQMSTYQTIWTVSAADYVANWHTRIFVAEPAGSGAEHTADQQVLIKDSWPDRQLPLGSEPREAVFLHEIGDRFAGRQLPFLYPRMVAGEYGRLGHDGHSAVNMTNAEFEYQGIAGPGLGQRPRAHCRIAMSPVGHHLQTVTCEEELVVVLADVMRFHRALRDECNILHCGISVDNILVVREKGNPVPRGLLINLENAVRVDADGQAPQPAKFGRRQFMSIANLLDLDASRTVLDDWESLICVIGWLASKGICSADCIQDFEAGVHPILNWRHDYKEMIAQTKRNHMDAAKNFEKNIVDHFQEQYVLLAELAMDLRTALFDFAECSGTTPPVRREHTGDSRVDDPLLRRAQFTTEISDRVQAVMDRYEQIARDRLTERQGTASASGPAPSDG